VSDRAERPVVEDRAGEATPGRWSWRAVTVALVAVLLVTGTTAYLLSSRADTLRAGTTTTSGPSTAPAEVPSGPRIVFRNTAIGPDYGKVAVVPLASPAGPRTMTGHSCDRVFAAARRTLCLASEGGLVTAFTAKTWTDDDGAVTELPLTGVPSRARLSRDATLAATTTFVAGDSYAATTFATRTVISVLGTGQRYDLEDFRLVHRGKVIRPTDRNYWGVTFADDADQFYATVRFDSLTWLVRGRISTRTIETVRPDAECPSLSPDGTKVAYKKRGKRSPGDWRLAVLELRTGLETALAEGRSVDDQVEWFDGRHVIYGLPGVGARAAETNVWVVPADGSGTAQLLIARAWSPAVIR
jgi:hypothetical protein